MKLWLGATHVNLMTSLDCDLCAVHTKLNSDSGGGTPTAAFAMLARHSAKHTTKHSLNLALSPEHE